MHKTVGCGALVEIVEIHSSYFVRFKGDMQRFFYQID